MRSQARSLPLRHEKPEAFSNEQCTADSNQPEAGAYFARRWKDAYEVCQRNLNSDDIKYLQKIDDCESFKKILRDTKSNVVHSSNGALINRLDPILGHLNTFVTLLALSVGGGSAVQTALIWGVLSLTIQAVQGMSQILNDTVEMLDTLGHDLEVLEILEESFVKKPLMAQELVEIFVEIIIFWTGAVYFLQRTSHEHAALGHWPLFKADFKKSSDKIRVRTNRMKEKAMAIAMSSSRPAVLLENLDTHSSFLGAASGTISTIDTPFPCNNIPFPRNTNFIGRKEELRLIQQELAPDVSFHNIKGYALCGEGGIGKTQTALEFAYIEVDATTEAVFWVNCETNLEVERSFAEIAIMLGLDGAQSGEDSNQNRLLVLKWLRNTSVSWVMILDNIEDVETLNSCWPVASHGSILVTSRRSVGNLELISSAMALTEFSAEQGASILQQIVGRSTYSNAEKTAAEDLSKELGGLPLALVIMAAQVKRRRKSFKDFLELYQNHAIELHIATAGVTAYYKRSLRTCWHTAFESLDANAFSILAILSFIAPNDIPERLFKYKLNSLSSINPLAFCGNDLLFDDAILLLLDVSLVRRTPDTQFISIHRLIQLEFRNYMGLNMQTEYFYLASRLLYEAFPKQINGASLRREGKRCKEYVQHVQMLCSYWKHYKSQPAPPGAKEELIKLTTNCSWYLYESVAWREGIEFIEIALDICDDHNGINYAHLLNSYASIEVDRGHAEKSIKLYSECLGIRLNLLGEMHIEVCNVYNNLGNAIMQAYATPSVAQDAINKYLKAIEISKIQPVEDRKTIEYPTYLNISRAYLLTGEYDLGLKNLDIAEATIGELFEPDTYFHATCFVHRANILYAKGDIDSAEKLWRRAFPIYYAASETEPHTTFVQYKLACLAIERGEIEEAIPSLERILIICRLRERAKGDKGEIARVTRTLADAVALQGDTSKAARLIAESEKMRKEIQSERKWQPPDEKRAYDILVWNEYW